MKWEGLAAGATGRNLGKPYACPSYPIKSVQVKGTWGGAVCTIEGSNMADSAEADMGASTATYDTLHNPQGTNLTPTGDSMRGISENTFWVRPNVSGGDATTDIDVYLLCVTER